MPNRSSNAEHIPVRTCVICRTKDEKEKMIRFTISDNDLVFDWQKKLNMRGCYTCNSNDCIILLDKWLKKKTRNNSRKRNNK